MEQNDSGSEIPTMHRKTCQDTEVQRAATYEQLWGKGSQHFWLGNYEDMLYDREANLMAYNFWYEKTAHRVKDHRKRSMLVPRIPPYAFGTKRPSLESGYFEAYNQSNVDLVGLREDSIVNVEAAGVRMQSGVLHDLDVLVLATGFDFAIGSQLAIDFVGVDGVTLQEKWGIRCKQTSKESEILTYLGIMCSGFPNMLMCLGPQTVVALSVSPRLAELQGSWIARCLEYVVQQASKIETTEAAEMMWKEHITSTAERSLLAITDGWYNGNNIPGRKKEALFCFDTMPAYTSFCEYVAANGYCGFSIS